MISQADDDFIKGLKAKEAKMKEDISTKKKEIAMIEKQMAAVKRVIEAFEGIKYGIELKNKIRVPEEYSKSLTWSEKVLWAINKIGGGFVDDITAAIANMEPDLNKETLKRIVTQYASQLKKNNYLKHEKSGIRFKYFIAG